MTDMPAGGNGSDDNPPIPPGTPHVPLDPATNSPHGADAVSFIIGGPHYHIEVCSGVLTLQISRTAALHLRDAINLDEVQREAAAVPEKGWN